MRFNLKQKLNKYGVEFCKFVCHVKYALSIICVICVLGAEGLHRIYNFITYLFMINLHTNYVYLRLICIFFDLGP